MQPSTEERGQVREASQRSRWFALAAVVCCAAACGPDKPAPHAGSTSAHVPISVGLDSHAYLVGVRQSVTVVARVTGTTDAVTWTLNCESGQASIVASGNSATITGIAGGMCFVWASEGDSSDYAIVRVPPLTMGDSCSASSQCGADAPLCARSGGCGPTCTLACTSSDDCPTTHAFGPHVPCSNGRCRLIRDPDWSCP